MYVNKFSTTLEIMINNSVAMCVITNDSSLFSLCAYLLITVSLKGLPGTVSKVYRFTD